MYRRGRRYIYKITRHLIAKVIQSFASFFMGNYLSNNHHQGNIRKCGFGASKLSLRLHLSSFLPCSSLHSRNQGTQPHTIQRNKASGSFFGGWGNPESESLWMGSLNKILVAWFIRQVLWGDIIRTKYLGGIKAEIWMRDGPIGKPTRSTIWISFNKIKTWLLKRSCWSFGSKKEIIIGRDRTWARRWMFSTQKI